MIYKQKSDFKITGMIPALVSLFIFAISTIIFGIQMGFSSLGVVILIYAALIFYGYLRTNHTATLLATTYMICYGLTLVTMAPHMIRGRKVELPVVPKLFLALTLFLFIWLMYLNFKRRLKWRGREILELAAQHIESTQGILTERPLPTGRVSFSKEELLSFVSFFESRLLGLCYIEDDRIVFMPLKFKNEYFALYNPNYNYLEKTWVAIGFNGNVSVNISRSDYYDYKENLAFDQLCNSLSDLIIEFVELYLEGSEVRIIDRMNQLKVNIFS